MFEKAKMDKGFACFFSREEQTQDCVLCVFYVLFVAY